MVSTYEGFTNLYDIPYTIIVIVYLLLKYVVLFEVICNFCNKKCFHVKNCCGCWKVLTKLLRKITSWMVRIIFGGTDGISEHKPKTKLNKNHETEDQTNDNHALESEETEDGRKVYIRGIEVKGIDLDILAIIILCFGLLLLLTMYSTYLLDVSFICSEDPTLYCFPQLVSNNDINNSVIDTNKRITNCDIWTNQNVTFRCFEYALNAKEALVVGGGLMSIFVVGMQTIISILVNIYQHTNNYRRIRQALKITVLVILVFVNLIASVIIMLFTLAGTRELFEFNDPSFIQNLAAILAENGVQLVIILGTVELLLLIQWEYYQEEKWPRKKGGKSDQAKKLSDNTELIEIDP